MPEFATPEFATIPAALAALQQGLPVLVLDDEDRENEGDVILAAQTTTESWMAWTIRHTSGYLCAPMTNAWADRIELPLMVPHGNDPRGTAYTITVDAATGVSTGISAADRTRTVRLLADPDCAATDFTRPGHIVPLRARDGGVLERGGHTEAGVDLCRLAGLAPVAVIGELVHDEGPMMRRDAVLALGAEHELPVVTVAQLRRWRESHDRVERVATTALPTEHGIFTLHGYRDRWTGAEHIALVSPLGLVDGMPGHDSVVTRVHSECLTGDAFGSRRCDCGPQLDAAMAFVARRGGLVIYLRGHEGRGVGLLAKLQAYALQDQGRDTVDAQLDLGLPVDAREYGAAAAILRDLDAVPVTLLTNNPDKVDALTGHGIEVAGVVPLRVPANPSNLAYLRTKRDRLGHAVLTEAYQAGTMMEV